MPLTSRLTMRSPQKQKMLTKLLPKKRNKRKRQKNWKDVITAKIGVKAVCLQAKTALRPVGLSKNNTTPTKRAVDFHKPSRNNILSLVEKESG